MNPADAARRRRTPPRAVAGARRPLRRAAARDGALVRGERRGAAARRAAGASDAAEIGWLTSAVQLGFVAGTARLRDPQPARPRERAGAGGGRARSARRRPTRRWSAAPGYAAALASRFATGVFLAGVYPPAMKMAATWFRSAPRARHRHARSARSRWARRCRTCCAPPRARAGRRWCSRCPAGALARRRCWSPSRTATGPSRSRGGPFSWGLAGTRGRAPRDAARRRSATSATCGSCTRCGRGCPRSWPPARSRAARRAEAAGGDRRPCTPSRPSPSAPRGACGAAGWPTASAARGWSPWPWRPAARCALVIGLFFGASPVAPAARSRPAWGFFVIADSAQFSALVTEVAPPHAVGPRSRCRRRSGFLLTTATIQLVPAIADAPGWQWAFPVLAARPGGGHRRHRQAQATLAQQRTRSEVNPRRKATETQRHRERKENNIERRGPGHSRAMDER